MEGRLDAGFNTEFNLGSRENMEHTRERQISANTRMLGWVSAYRPRYLVQYGLREVRRRAIVQYVS
jgi:hypothetical protein